MRTARGVRSIFRYRARNMAYPEYPMDGRWHAYTDCWEIVGNGCQAVAVPEGAPERPLCWSCVARGFR